MRKFTVVTAIAALTACGLAACSDPDDVPADQSNAGASSGAQSATSSADNPMASTGITPFDTSQIPVQDDIAALVPQEIKDRDVLRNGASTDYAPAEFRGDDGQTPVGYEVDLVRGLAQVLGLSEGTTTHAEFPTIIPALGTKFDIGMSAFTITPEREKETNFVQFIEVGSAYAVSTGNPKNFDPADPCGATLGVQNGTFQHEYANELSAKCEADGKPAIQVMPMDLQTDVATKVVGGQYDATLADSTVISYTVKLTQGQLEQVGDVIEAAPQGVAVSKSDQALTDALAKAMQYLMDSGYLEKILASYGADSSALDTATVNPPVE